MTYNTKMHTINKSMLYQDISRKFSSDCCSSVTHKNKANTKKISEETLNHTAKFNNKIIKKRLRYEAKRFIHTLATLYIKRLKAINPIKPK